MQTNQFLGDTVGRTIIKLLVISILVGMVMSVFDIAPFDVLYGIRDFFIRLYDLGFEAVYRIAKYFLWGALVVIPIFFVLRILRMGR